jgi:hypothetical protein
MVDVYKRRRVAIIFSSLVIFAFVIISNTPIITDKPEVKSASVSIKTGSAVDALNKLTIKGRAAKTGYTREQFGNGWLSSKGCDTRNIILNRDLKNVAVNDKCEVISGLLDDPYSGKVIQFLRGSESSSAVQIDHVVALSDAWQKVARALSSKTRVALANDPLELLAVDGPSNMQKSDGDAATWLPPNKAFRCMYVARQIAVKRKYNLWLTQAEHDAMVNILDKCPGQLLPSP